MPPQLQPLLFPWHFLCQVFQPIFPDNFKSMFFFADDIWSGGKKPARHASLCKKFAGGNFRVIVYSSNLVQSISNNRADIERSSSIFPIGFPGNLHTRLIKKGIKVFYYNGL